MLLPPPEQPCVLHYYKAPREAIVCIPSPRFLQVRDSCTGRLLYAAPSSSLDAAGLVCADK